MHDGWSQGMSERPACCIPSSLFCSLSAAPSARWQKRAWECNLDSAAWHWQTLFLAHSFCGPLFSRSNAHAKHKHARTVEKKVNLHPFRLLSQVVSHLGCSQSLLRHPQDQERNGIRLHHLDRGRCEFRRSLHRPLRKGQREVLHYLGQQWIYCRTAIQCKFFCYFAFLATIVPTYFKNTITYHF